MLAFLTQACEDKVTNQSTVCMKPILAVCGVCDALQGTQEQVTEVQALDHNTSPSSSSFPVAGENRALECWRSGRSRTQTVSHQANISHRAAPMHDTGQPFV